MKLAVHGWAELLDGSPNGAQLISWGHKAIVAYYEGLAVGVLTWSDQEHINQLWINLAYVAPDARRLGCHTAMFEALIDKAREMKRATIGSGAAIGNKPSLASMRKQGRVQRAITTEYHVRSAP
jgi:GNAT superfamily N-acetyltransferase